MTLKGSIIYEFSRQDLAPSHGTFLSSKMVGVRVPMGTRKPTTYLNDNISLKIFNPIYFDQSPFLNNIVPINTKTPRIKDKLFGPIQ